ncbi:hypothetical protein N7478_002730 [Penicillium angulare]|uniref:uncharacterized protein n=1 Tax=Penicillium angulare TaxID=116970 RepID=UPI00254002D1|nr:uncharacterized protein N7478_002730 [Penicillium angulare]KAJ5287044.1 hypothetical protein N7478_002730 [Penicillium angulare]
MFKALMGGGRSSSDARSTTSSSSRSTRRRADSTKSSHSRKSSRGDDRDRGLDELSYSPSASGSRRAAPSVAGDSVASTYVTAEPDSIESPDPMIIERTPKRRDSDRDSKSSHRRARDRSESRDRDKRKSRRASERGLDDDLDNERERRQFGADVPSSGSPHHGASPETHDPHIQHQFPGQFPTDVAQPYYPPNNPAGAAADYYGDQGQSVSEQPGVRPHKPPVIPNSQAHLMTASPSVNPPPEPSTMGQVGAAAAYFDDEFTVPEATVPAKPTSSRPPKPGKISSKPTSSSAIPTAAAAAGVAGAAAYGLSGGSSSYHEESQHSTSAVQQSTSYSQSNSYPQPAATSTNRPPQSQSHSHSHSHSHGVGTGVGVAAAGAAAGYMLSHHDHPPSSNPEDIAHYNFHNYDHPSPSPSGAPPYTTGANNAMLPPRPAGPMSKFADFWRDPEGVGRFEDYTESIGLCKYCFEPGTSSVDAPRQHHYHGRRHSADRYSSSSGSRVDKLSRYQPSEDESRRRKRSGRSNKSTSWLPGVLAGGLFAGKEFNDSYSVRSGRVADERVSSYDAETASMSDRKSYTSRGVVRRPRSPPHDHYQSDSKYSRRTRSRSRSSSRSGRHSFVKEAALGAAVGGAALAVAKSHQRSRSRSPARGQRRKESSSSASFVDVSRPSSKSVGGFTSFFTSSSDNRKKKRSKRRGFFSFNSSSSSSLDADLAFGSGFSKKAKAKLSKKEGKKKKNEDVNAAILGLGATATALAASSPHGRSRSTGQILTARESRSRHSNYASSANEDEEWIDAESEDQSSQSVSSALAFGASSTDSGSDSSPGGWNFFGFNKKKKKSKKEKKSSAANAALAAGVGALGGAAIASVARDRDSRVSSSTGSLQQVYPMATGDPARFDAIKMSPSVLSRDQTPLVRPGPIPLQQPQPVTPVSQAVYTTQGGLPGSIPAYSPADIPPIFANDRDLYRQQVQGSREPAWIPEDRREDFRKPRRRDSSPIFPVQESSISGPKRRSTTKDLASVSFALTDEQTRQQDRRDRKSRDDFSEEPVKLVDREEEEARQEKSRREFERREYERREYERQEFERQEAERQEAERRETERQEQRRRERDEEERHRCEATKEKDTYWKDAAEVVAAGALTGVAASTVLSSSKSDDATPSDRSTDRYSKSREKRRKEREQARQDMESSVIAKSDVPVPVEDDAPAVEHKEDRSRSSSRRASPVYENYADFYAPEEFRRSPDQHKDIEEPTHQPTIVEIVPASEREDHQPEKQQDELFFGPEPYEDRNLPWDVPGLTLTKPTPDHSVNGSVTGTTPTAGPPDVIVEGRQRELERHSEPEQQPQPEPEPEPVREAEQESEPEWKPQRSTTGSRVSWGHDKTHEYEVFSSSEHEPTDYDISPLDDSNKDFAMTPPDDKSRDITSNRDIGTDIEFAAIVAAGTEAAGFDPSVVINDPKYHTRTSPPGSEDEGTFSPRSKWIEDQDKSHGFVEGEIENDESNKSRDMQPSIEHVIEAEPLYSEPEAIEKNIVSPSEPRERTSIAQRAMEELNEKRVRSTSPENDVLSMPGGFDTPEDTREFSQYRDDSRSVFSAPVEREIETPTKSKKSRRSGDDLEFLRDAAGPAAAAAAAAIAAKSFDVNEDEDADKKKHRKRRSKRDSDTFSVADDNDDARSVMTFDDDDDDEKSERRRRRHHSSRDSDSVSLPGDDDEKSERRRRRHHSSRDDDSVSLPGDDDEKSERRRRRHHSSRDSDILPADDDAMSAVTAPEYEDKSERRKHRHRSSRDSVFDDTASITSSPARIDEREKEKRRGKDEKEKDKSGGILRSLFGSRVSTSEEKRPSSRTSSRSSSVDKRASREAVSEAGVDDEKRRRKRHSSHRSSSGDKLDDYDSDKVSVKSEANLEEYRSKRQEKEEKRRQRYGDIVDSGRRRDSEKV